MIEDKIKRIISLAPSGTEILYFLGLGERVVGVTVQCDWPEEAKAKEKVGSFSCPDREKITFLKPHLLIAYRGIHDRFVGEFKKRGMQVFLMSPTKTEDILADMERLVCLTGLSGVTEARVRSLRERLRKFKAKVYEDSKPKAFRLMGDGSIFTPTKCCYQYDAIILAGGSPIPVNSSAAYVSISLEDLIKFNPDIIIGCGRKKDEKPKKICQGCIRENPICQRVIDDIRNREGWGDIKAVREGRIYSIPCEIICRPGPRVFDGIERIAELINSTTRNEDMNGEEHVH